MIEERNKEIKVKKDRITHFLDAKGYDALLLMRQRNFAWFTCGGNNRIIYNQDPGLASILVTKDKYYLISQNVESPRILKEEVGNLGFEFVQYDWYEENLFKTVRQIVKGKIASDMPFCDAINEEHELTLMRTDLTIWELNRCRRLGKDVALALSESCCEIEPGMSEFEIQGILGGKLYSKGIYSPVLLVGTDDRIFNFRHPVPTSKLLKKYAMLVICAEKWGLILAATRIVHFGKVPNDLQCKYQSLKKVNATMILNSRPGNTIGKVFKEFMQVYEDEGFPGEWKFHYQGGVCGYASREIAATPDSNFEFKEKQIVAWNPTIRGVKNEDSFIINRDGFENITRSVDWPYSITTISDGEIETPEILVRD